MQLNENKNDGWPEKFSILPTPLEVIKSIGHFLCDHIRYETPSEHRGGGPLLDHELYDKTVIHTHVDNGLVTRTVVNAWKEAEATYDDGATSPSTFDTFEERNESR